MRWWSGWRLRWLKSTVELPDGTALSVSQAVAALDPYNPDGQAVQVAAGFDVGPGSAVTRRDHERATGEQLAC